MLVTLHLRPVSISRPRRRPSEMSSALGRTANYSKNGGCSLREEAATLLSLNPRTRTRDLGTTVAPNRAICKYRPVRGIARIIRESYLQWLRSLTRFLAYLSIFHMLTNLRVPSAKTHFPRSIHSEIVKNLGKVELNAGKWQTVFMKLNFNQSKLISKSMTYFEKKVLNFNKYLNNTNLIFTYNK